MPDSILNLQAPAADMRIPYGSCLNQFLDIRFPKARKGPWGLVINIHGGFWRAKYNLEHAGHLCAVLTAQGLATANIEYRRIGNEGGGWPNSFADVRTAYRFLRQNAKQHNLDPQRIVIIGHSAGGQLALCIAAHEPSVSRIVSLAGVVDLQRAYRLHLSNDAVVEFLGGTPSEVPEHYHEADPMQLYIPQARQWLVHGAADDVVPPAFSRDYVAAKKKPGKHEDREKWEAQLLEIPGADHFDLIDPRSAAWERFEKTVLELLR
jgi:acetyl esterase/lipase